METHTVKGRDQLYIKELNSKMEINDSFTKAQKHCSIRHFLTSTTYKSINWEVILNVIFCKEQLILNIIFDFIWCHFQMMIIWFDSDLFRCCQSCSLNYSKNLTSRIISFILKILIIPFIWAPFPQFVNIIKFFPQNKTEQKKPFFQPFYALLKFQRYLYVFAHPILYKSCPLCYF